MPPASLSMPAPPPVDLLPADGVSLARTFVLRCASFCAGIMIPISLGLRSRTEHDVTVGLAGLVAVTFYASELIGAPIFGSLSDRFGRKLFMLLGPILG